MFYENWVILQTLEKSHRHPKGMTLPLNLATAWRFAMTSEKSRVAASSLSRAKPRDAAWG